MIALPKSFTLESTRARAGHGMRPRTPALTRGRVELRPERARSPKTIHLLLLLAFSLVARAQTFTTLYSFTEASGYPDWVNSDGAYPRELILSGSTLYGTAGGGGSAGGGTVFAVSTDGTEFTTLNAFTGVPFEANSLYGGLILSGDTLYGTTRFGGIADKGTVFAVSTDGTGFTTLYDFTGGDDGATPQDGLILSGNTLYGTALTRGSSGKGTVFAIKTDGTGFTTLYNFSGGDDGAGPQDGLILSDNTLYGTAYGGGSSGNGTVFALNTDGTDFTTLHSFTGSDGANPQDRLSLSGNTSYGSSPPKYGSSSVCTVFALNTNGTGFTILHRFTATRADPSGTDTNSDGFYPHGLVVSGNTLYGTAGGGGINGNGTVFAVSTNGTGFTTLYSFTATSGVYPDVANSDGAHPLGLILSDDTLYGTAGSGGINGSGTVFSLSLPVSPPQLTINPSGILPSGIILTWPANAAGFTLQSTTNLIAQAVWTTVSPRPIQTGDQEVVTLDITSNNQFFRLRK
jgi:uncharacterized repeat protein (TIGR03803 family)